MELLKLNFLVAMCIVFVKTQFILELDTVLNPNFRPIDVNYEEHPQPKCDDTSLIDDEYFTVGNEMAIKYYHRGKIFVEDT